MLPVNLVARTILDASRAGKKVQDGLDARSRRKRPGSRRPYSQRQKQVEGRLSDKKGVDYRGLRGGPLGFLGRHRSAKKRLTSLQTKTVLCYKCRSPMDLVLSPFEAKGVIVKDAEGYHCSRCGLDAYSSDQVDAISRIVYALAPPIRLTRKISSAAGKKPVIYLPSEILHAAGARVGDRVDLTVGGPGRIVLTLSHAEKPVVVVSSLQSKKVAKATAQV